ncbi:MAG: PP2C family serine/threonine-protein phosphatase [Caldilineaceae bacterium]
MKQWQMLAASIPGAGHLRYGLPCQDAHRVEPLAGGVVAAVADGLGSAACAERGAQVAVNVAITHLQEALAADQPMDAAIWTQVLQQVFAGAREALVALAAADDRAVADYATTLIVIVVTDEWLALGQLGDGAVVVQGTEGTPVTLSQPQRGEYANETWPLTHPEALAAVYYLCRPEPVQAVALFTDGVQNLCLTAADYTPYQPFFTPLFTQLAAPLDRAEAEAALAAFLQSERISKRSDDDKTLVLLGQVNSVYTDLFCTPVTG